MKKIASVMQLFNANPAAIAVLLILRRSWTKTKSFVLARLFRALAYRSDRAAGSSDQSAFPSAGDCTQNVISGSRP